jgi:hypothetical protein
MDLLLKKVAVKGTTGAPFSLIKYDTDNQRDDAFPGRSGTPCTGFGG